MTFLQNYRLWSGGNSSGELLDLHKSLKLQLVFSSPVILSWDSVRVPTSTTLLAALLLFIRYVILSIYTSYCICDAPTIASEVISNFFFAKSYGGFWSSS
jgi:hypothetical protein